MHTQLYTHSRYHLRAGDLSRGLRILYHYHIGLAVTRGCLLNTYIPMYAPSDVRAPPTRGEHNTRNAPSR